MIQPDPADRTSAPPIDVGELRDVLAALPVLLFSFDAQGVSVLSEGGLLEPMQYRPGETVGWTLNDFAPLFPDLIEHAGRCLRGEMFSTRSSEADALSLDMHWIPRRSPDGEVIGMIGFASETSDTFDATALERSHRDYRALLSALPDHILRLHPDGTVLTVKPATDPRAAQPGPAWIPRPIDEVLPPDIAALLLRAAGEVQVSRREQLLEYGIGPGDAAEHFETRVLPAQDGQVLVIVRDVTRRRAEEAQQQQSSKLEALGRLSAGVAHEINTPIQFVSNNVEFMSQAFGSMHELLLTYRAALGGSDPRPWAERAADLAAREKELDVDFLLGEVPQAVEETLQGTRRVSTIVRAMKVFSHPSARELVEADINDAVANAVVVSASHHKLIAEVELDLGDLPPVLCVIGEITQVLLNLVINAAQALEARGVTEGRKGRIALRTRQEGEHVVVTVTDDGIGIPYEEQARVFEAFYTTKEVGVGTGQGLSLAWTIVVDNHDGRLALRSTPGVGTTFEMCLPIAGPARTKQGRATPPLVGQGRQ